MDGVLIDSVKYNWQAMNEVLAQYGIHIADDQLRKYIGQSLITQVEQISSEYGVELDYATIRDSVAPIKQKLLENIQPKEGVVELLKVLRENEILIAVGTSSNRSDTEQKLTQAGIIDYFDVLVTEDDVTTHKPDPAVYLMAAEKLHTQPSNCVVFEDAPSGILAAKRAGMVCIAVQTPFTNNDDLSGADMIVGSLLEVCAETINELID